MTGLARAVLLAAALGFALHASAQDETRVLHGVTIADPYYFLEDGARPETQAFFRDQDAKARAALERIPGRAALLARIRDLSAAGVAITQLKLEAGKVFYLRRARGR
jgi:prolyl oligopeptidase